MRDFIVVGIEVAAVALSSILYRRGLRRVRADLKLGAADHLSGFGRINAKLDVIEREMGEAMEQFGLRRSRM